MQIPTFQEAVDELVRLGGRVVIDGDIATSVAAVRLHFTKRGWPIDEPVPIPELPSVLARGKNVAEIDPDADEDAEPVDLGNFPATASAVSHSVVDAIMELSEDEIRKQLADRMVTVPVAITDKEGLATLLAQAAGYTVNLTSSEPSAHFDAIAAKNTAALAEMMAPKPLSIVGPVLGRKAADPPPPADPPAKGKK